jgi:hypothetical protein
MASHGFSQGSYPNGNVVTGIENQRQGLRVDLESGIIYCLNSRVYLQFDDPFSTDGVTTWTGQYSRQFEFRGLFEFDFYYKRGWGNHHVALDSIVDAGAQWMLISIYDDLSYAAFPFFPGALEINYRTP